MKMNVRFFTFVAIALLWYTNFLAVAQTPSVSIISNLTNLTPGSQFTVPVVINGNEVGNYNFNIKYDRDVFTFVSAQYTGPMYGINGMGGSSNPNYLYSGQYYLKLLFTYSNAFPNPPTGASYSNDTVFLLTFTFNGGTSQFSFFNIATTNSTASQYTYLRALPYNLVNTSTVYNAGSASGSASNLTSIPAGGDWNTFSTWQENAGGGTKLPNGAYNVIITSNPVTVNPTTNLAKCYNLTVNSGGKLTLNTGKTLTVTGQFTINSGGSFVDQNLTSSLSAIVKRNITGNYSGSGSAGPSTIWHYVSSPVANGTIGSFLGCLLNKWTENSTGGIWDTLYLPLTLPLEIGRGYAVASTPTFGDAVFNGTMNTGDITRTGLTNSDPSYPANVNSYGYHLLGNPYPSALRWDASITRINVDAAIYLWNGSTYISKLPADNYEIQSVQGFFVHANANGGSVAFKNSSRVHNFGSFLKSSVENQLTLHVEGNNFSDETSVRFSDNATDGFDGEYDAFKLFGLYNCPQIYSMLPDLNLSINTLPDINNNPVIPVGFKTGLNGNFTITASGMGSFSAGTNFFLTDLVTGNVQNLNANPVYTFTAYPANPEHRFNLHFAAVGMNETSGSGAVKIYSFDKSVYINTSTQIKGDVVIYDLLGNEILRSTLRTGTLSKFDLGTVQGYYLVKVVAEGLVASEKVFIR